MTIRQGLEKLAELRGQKANITARLKQQTTKVQKLTELVTKPEGKAVKEKIINEIKGLEEYIKTNPQDLNARRQLSNLQMIVNK